MNKSPIRLWIARLRRLPQRASGWLLARYRRIPAKARLYLGCALLAVLTAFSASHFPLLVLPQYRVGDTVNADVVVPAHLLVPTTSDTLKNNRVLLRAGEVVSSTLLPQLDAVRQFQLAQRRPQRLLGLLGLLAACYFALYRAATSSQSIRLEPRAAFWVAASGLLLQTGLVRAGMFAAAVLSARPETMRLGDILVFQFGIPYAACALVVALLAGSQFGLIAGLMSAVLAGFISPHGPAITAFALAAVVTAVYSVQLYRDRNSITDACVAIGAVNFLAGLAALLLADHPWSLQTISGTMLMSVAGALLTAGTASLATPIYESAFDILTDMKLLELSNADLPLLRRLAIETPGTNHHSFMVGVLAEAAAKAIGANALLARTGCLYHDIGKLAAPTMYIENQQGGPNPHDKVAPTESVDVITGHVRRGIKMAEQADLPPRIIDFIPQHHGTRVLAFFYHKAKSQAEARGESVNIDDFRYPGPKPQSKEAAILMLADGSEAAVRSLDDRSKENIQAIIRKIADTVLADGQLDEANLTLRELMVIRETLVKTLADVYHQRISYPGYNPPSNNGAGAPSN